MVKADLTRDYYADLDLPPGADTATIKKQFKKLALTYHPDRNPGRESEVTAKFQNIQSAHEVLTDPQERAKYDSNRTRSSTKYGNAYAGSSGVRGNPWSDLSSQYPPPPKAPTARRPPNQQQASAGAERYRKWEAPKQSAYQAAHEGAGARQKTYEAWESMKTKPQPFGQQSQPSSHGGSSRTSKAPQVPPRGPPQPSQEENFYGRTRNSPPKPSPFHESFRPESPPKRSHSTNAFNRKGFMPNTPGGDEPAAPRAAYFTERNKPAVAPELPSRGTPQRPPQATYPEPARDFTAGTGHQPSRVNLNKSSEAPIPEPRISTPYSTHGGEKLNPFETSHLNRAKSTREASQRFTADGQIPRTGSDPNIASPHRSQSFATRGASKSKHQTKPSVEIESDSSDGPELNGGAFGRRRQRTKVANGASAANTSSQVPDSPLGSEHHHGPPRRSNQTQNDVTPEPSIFSFSINEDTFKSSAAKRPSTTSFSNSAENISTKFSEKDWTGKFEGSDYFKPEPKPNASSRAQSGSRSRGRSPTKPTFDTRYSQHRGSESEPVAESPGGTRFSAKEWADTFKPQTFAPPPPRQVPVRKRTGPAIRSTMGGSAAVIDDEDNTAEKPLFNGNKTPVTPTIPSPDAMDVDMPPPKNSVPQFKPTAPLNVETTTSPKRAAAPSQSPTDEAALKVNFDDLKIQDLLSSLEMPRPPLPPGLPDNLPGTRPSPVAYEDYQVRFAKYMTAWDLYNNQFMLHLVARKNQNDNLGTKRWLSDEGLEIYRRGLKEDGMVLGRWATEKEKHETVVREWLVLREQMKESATRDGSRPKKKAH